MANEWTPDTVFDVLADERVRAVLIATHIQERSVKDLDNELGASQSSIYRRVDVLVNYDFLVEQTKVDAEGHHYSVYKPNFENIDIRLEDEQVVVRAHFGDDSVRRWDFDRDFTD